MLVCSPVFSQSTGPFTLDEPNVQTQINDYWNIYGISESTIGRNGATPPVSNQSNALEWMAVKSAWTDHPIRSQLIGILQNMPVNGINAQGKQPRGYVWADSANEAWRGMHLHYDQMARYICAAAEIWRWTRDREFLDRMLPRAEAAMSFMLDEMDGNSGIVACPGEANGLSDTGKPSTFIDCYREGYQVAWINEGFYSALLALRDMENASGQRTKAARYNRLVSICLDKFNRIFWSETDKRYVGWNDIRGDIHDYGFTYLNLEALARGMGNAEQAYHIFRWLEGGRAQPTVKGAHKGSTDIYQLVVAPRTNTIRIADKDWDPWSVPERPILKDFHKYGYGGITRDGGTMLWLNYYDVMARLKWLDANSAWKRLSAMLARCAGDPKFLTFGPQGTIHFRAYDMYEEHFLEIGSADTYQSSGISVMPVLRGFMGVQPAKHGISVLPNLPTGINQIGCSEIAYGKSSYDITITRTKLTSRVKIKIMKSEPTSTIFYSPGTFNALTLPASSVLESKFLLMRKMGRYWQPVSVDVSDNNRLLTADQPSGTYKLQYETGLQDDIRKMSAYKSIYEISCPQVGFKRRVAAGSSVLIEFGD